MTENVVQCPSSAAAVANFFLDVGSTDQEAPVIDQMKLQKLLFYAHGWYLGNTGTPLFGEDIEAWPWGPVVRDVYNQTRQFGRGRVTSYVQEPSADGGRLQWVTPNVADAALREYLGSVWGVYRGFSGIQLSNSTHGAGEPWTVIRDLHGTLDHKPTIPTNVIAEIFKKKVADAAAGNPPAK